MQSPTQPPGLPPQALVDAIRRQAPGIVVDEIAYTQGGRAVRAAVHDPRYSQRGPVNGFAPVDPATGRILSRDYLPGHQPTGMSVLTVFFALHFGSFGGQPVRWMYVALGLGGAVLFYAGNRLWVVARRRRERRDGRGRDSFGTWFLDRLTPGWSFGCVAGISALLCATPVLPKGGGDATLQAVFYGVFLLCVGMAFAVPSRWSERAPMLLAALCTLAFAPIAVLARPAGLTTLALASVSILIGAALLVFAGWSGRAPRPSRRAPGHAESAVVKPSVS